MKKKVFIVLFILVIIIAIVSSSFAVYFKITENRKQSELQSKIDELTVANQELEDYKKEKEEEQKSNEADQSGSEANIIDKYYNFVTEEGINTNQDFIYSIDAYNLIIQDCFYYNYDESNNSIQIRVNNKEKASYYYNIPENQVYTINNFDCKVVDTYTGHLAQTEFGDTLFFLMEDGSVEYLPLAKAISENNVKSYGKVPNVQDVIKLVNCSVHLKNGPAGFRTTIAVKEDGSFYDLGDILDLY